MVLQAGFEPARPYGQRILSPPRLPIPPPEPIDSYFLDLSVYSFNLETSRRNYQSFKL